MMPLRRSWIYEDVQIELILRPRPRMFPKHGLRAPMNTRIGGGRGSGAEYRLCYKCGERGHLQRWCPWGRESERRVEPIRCYEQWAYDPDTGRWGDPDPNVAVNDDGRYDLELAVGNVNGTREQVGADSQPDSDVELVRTGEHLGAGM
ncbi:unnamed protein product [Gordionus sp. m RMFG-2023]